jgi:hypothetical protein
MAAKKKPSAAQLAARAKFVAMVREKSKAKKSATKKATVKKVAPKKAATKKASTHKDTKSHNVNIRIISGTGEFSATHALKQVDSWNNIITELRKELKKATPSNKIIIKQDIALAKSHLLVRKRQLQKYLSKINYLK